MRLRRILEKFDELSEIRILYGSYDLIAKAKRNLIQKLNRLVLKVRNMPEVARTVALVFL